ncbi:hypothetical protein ACQPT2_03115 [Erwinia amylovora]
MNDNTASKEIVSLGDWVLTLLLTGIPGLNVIILVYWSLNKNIKISKRNFARASLLLISLVIIFYFLMIEMTAGYFLFKHY